MTMSDWVPSRFLLSLGAASLLAIPILPGCVTDDPYGGGDTPPGFEGDDDDNPDNPDDPVIDDGTALRGVVRDAFGLPVAGVTVTTSHGYETETDHQGRFLIEDVESHERALIDFYKTGYAKAQTPFQIIEDVHNQLNQTLAEVDFEASFDSAEGLAFEIEEGGPSVVLPAANFVDADGNTYDGSVNVEATFFDLTSEMENGNEIFAIPGDFTAIDSDGADQTLESFGMFQVNLTGENGEELNLDAEAAPIVMPIQSLGSTVAIGDTVPAWSYNESTGKWVEEAIGTVIELDDGSLAWSFEANHFSTWNCDQPLPSHGCVTGIVTNSQGTPRQGATVRAVGMTYISTTTARTAADGSFCLEVKNGETVWLEISYSIGGQPATQRTDPVTIPAGQATCTDGDASDCVDMGIIPVDIMSCVSGVVIDSQNQPMADVDVVSPQGGIATTDSSGAFCLSVPVFQTTQVYVLTNQDSEFGFQPVQMFTQPGLPNCSGGCANIAVLRPYVETSCASGEVIINGNAMGNILVEVFDNAFPDVSVFSTLTASDGTYCAEIPAVGEVTVQVGSGDNVCGSEVLNTSSLGGEVCDESSQAECVTVADFVCSL